MARGRRGREAKAAAILRDIEAVNDAGRVWSEPERQALDDLYGKYRCYRDRPIPAGPRTSGPAPFEKPGRFGGMAR